MLNHRQLTASKPQFKTIIFYQLQTPLGLQFSHNGIRLAFPCNYTVHVFLIDPSILIAQPVKMKEFPVAMHKDKIVN